MVLYSDWPIPALNPPVVAYLPSFDTAHQPVAAASALYPTADSGAVTLVATAAIVALFVTNPARPAAVELQRAKQNQKAEALVATAVPVAARKFGFVAKPRLAAADAAVAQTVAVAAVAADGQFHAAAVAKAGVAAVVSLSAVVAPKPAGPAAEIAAITLFLSWPVAVVVALLLADFAVTQSIVHFAA